jgi:hypothetical protein
MKVRPFLKTLLKGGRRTHINISLSYLIKQGTEAYYLALIVVVQSSCFAIGRSAARFWLRESAMACLGNSNKMFLEYRVL